ncbi:Sigma-24 [uncultured Clostridium sp.]|uniref:RNA polymerase sigma factor n=1 Tax=uncultured Clostridium sp. TaxID=59620 RepID=UPI0008203BA7|nr:sigma-70 family RNA polymerase sigma factor [uncultured Clostridium sp.]SCJ94823.1 Sigma-24 [uncultured Clostridium sp.]
METQNNDVMSLDVKRAKRGDKNAFCNLIRINKVSMYRVAKSILNKEEDVEDAVSEAILKAYKNIKSLKDESFFKTWLIRIVINESNTIYKKRNREIAVENEHFINVQVNDKYKDLTLYNAINSLDEDLRTTTILFYFEDMKYKDIAKVLDVKEGTVKSRLSRAKEKLYNILKEELHG